MPQPSAFSPLGKHQICVELDALFWRVCGEVDLEEMRVLCETSAEVVTLYGHVFLVVDTRTAGSLTAEARRFQNDWQHSHRSELSRTVVFGANVAVRAIVTLMVRANALFSARAPQVDFVASESDALAWLSNRRARARRLSGDIPIVGK